MEIEIREFSESDAIAVRELFVRVNRALAPIGMEDAFEVYIAHSLAEEVDRISEYYSERGGRILGRYRWP